MRNINRVSRSAISLSAMAVIAAASLATVASAAHVYQWDDGTSELALGTVVPPSDVAWMNVFPVDPMFSVITGIETAFGVRGLPPESSGVNPGHPFHVHLWGDDDDDPTNGMTYLGSWAGTVSGESIVTDVLQSVAITPMDMSAFSHFAVGASVTTLPLGFWSGGYPAPVDTSVPVLGRSWVRAAAAGTWNPADPPFGELVSLNVFPALGGNGVFLIRAQAVPAPGALALLGCIGVIGTRRRC